MPIALPTPLGGTPVKMVMMHNYRQWGWSDVFYYSAAGASALDQWKDISAALREAAIAIDSCTGTGVQIVGARAAILNFDNGVFKTGNQSNLYSRADLGIPELEGQGPPESPWSAIMWDLSSADLTLDRRWLMRGAPAVAQQKQTPQGGFDPGNNAFVQGFQALLQRRIFGPAASAGTPPRGFAGQFAMKARDLRNVPSPFAAIQRVGSTGNPGFFTITVLAGDDWGALVGDKVLIQETRLEAGRGPAGLAQISEIEDLPGPPAETRFTITTRWSLSGPPVVKTWGRIRKYAEGLFPLQTISFERFVKRDTGRPFFGTRGRQPARR